MTTNGSNGANGHSNSASQSRFDPNFTQHVIDLMSPETKPRDRQILSSLIKHMHDFCRDVELTQDEWIIGVNYINSLGQAYQKNRNETWRLCDILGIESYEGPTFPSPHCPLPTEPTYPSSSSSPVTSGFSH